MDSIKTIACIQSTQDYEIFLSTLCQKSEDLIIVNDLSALQSNLKSSDNITIVFLDNSFINSIEGELSKLLQSDTCICIVLCNECAEISDRKPYIYDILECKKQNYIVNFLIRLAKDIECKYQLTSLKNETRRFYAAAKELSAEKDIEKALEVFINTCMEITSSDAGTVYIVIDGQNGQWSAYENNTRNKYLKFAIAKNKSIDLNLESTISPISKESICGFTVITGKSLCIDDVYNLPDDVDYGFNSSYDKKTGYKTKSILAIPMEDHDGHILGVIQLINKKAGSKIIPFTSHDETVVHSLAGQAAVELENDILYKNMHNLLDEYKLLISEEIVKRKRGDEVINQLMSAVEHSPVTVIITDSQGKIEYVNPKFTSLTGYLPSEVVGKSPSFLKSGIHPKEFYDGLWQTITAGKEWHGNFYNKKKNGEFYWESASITSIKDDNGVIKYFVAVKEDITEKKSFIDRLEKKNDELQKTIMKLNEAQSQLIQKERMAAIGQLAAGVAHEINNPLGFIMSNFETLKKYISKLRELAMFYRNLITDNAESGSTVINMLCDYEKKNKIDFIVNDLPGLYRDINEGMERVRNIVYALRTFSHIDQINNFEKYDLNAGIKTTLLIARNCIKYTAEVCESLGDIPFIEASGGEINQVILNLILNSAYAIKSKAASEPGIIKITTYRIEEYVYLEIYDNGTGIDKESINKIFEPFYTTKPAGEGTGLGLRLSYEIIVKRHGGDISIESTPGVGTKFIVRLPIKQNKR